MRKFEIEKPSLSDFKIMAGFWGLSGSGKTMSALEFATGLCGSDGKICVIDTERGRSNMYSKDYEFYRLDFDPPFDPISYLDAFRQVEEFVGHNGVIIVDSMSHIWEGEGGMLEMAGNAAQAAAKKSGRSPETYSFYSWREPKQQFGAFMRYIQSCSCHVIFCLRAKNKAVVEKDEKGKTQIVNLGVQPIIGDNFDYEMTFLAGFDPDNPGVPTFGRKTLARQFEKIFSGNKKMSAAHGKAFQEWCSQKPKKPAKTFKLFDHEGEVIGEYQSSQWWAEFKKVNEKNGSSEFIKNNILTLSFFKENLPTGHSILNEMESIFPVDREREDI